ncbi:MAG: CDP-alcohol phosphatidyltransferase family protein [Leeuwenhoekiella sp.]
MTISRYIPNSFTMANLFSGMLGTYFAATNRLDFAAYAVVLGIFFDFFDGFFARILNKQSDLGLQLDSLADVITSGVVPGMVMFQLLYRIESWGTGVRLIQQDFHWESLSLLPFLGFAITLASAYRLAKFNIDTRQTESFIGLPTPANALLIISLPLILMNESSEFAQNLISNTWFLLALTALSCYLLNAELPLFALKFKSWGFAENKVRYIFLILSVLLLIFLQFLAIPVIIVLYVIVSLLLVKSNSAK